MYLWKIINILEQIYQDDTNTIYPKQKYIFRSLFYFSPMEIKLVILGQDPYIWFSFFNSKKT